MRNFYKKAVFLNKMVLGLIISTPLYAYNFTDDQPHSETPPAGISSNQAPLFVSIGFDDNSVSGIAGSGSTGGMTWILDYLRNKKNRVGKGNSLIYLISKNLPLKNFP